MNQEFQELKRQYGVNSSERAKIFKDMQTNLKDRNNNNSEYTFEFTRNDTVNIDDCSEFEELLEIDGNMNLKHM